MILRLLTASLLTIFSSSVQAQEGTCSSPTINVLPFTVTEDFTKSYRELQEIGLANGEVGLVRVRSTVTIGPDKCTVTLGYKDAVMYVASELRRNECAFEHVKEHELEHVRIYEQRTAELKSRVEARIAKGEDLFEASKAEVLSVQELHAKHDSPDEYDKNRTACEGRIVRLALGRK